MKAPGHHLAAAAGADRPRPAAPGARRGLEPGVQRPGLCDVLVHGRRRRSSACRPTCSCHRARADDASFRLWRSRDGGRATPRSRAISAKSAPAPRLTATPPRTPCARSQGRSGLPAPALRRASARISDRNKRPRGLVLSLLLRKRTVSKKDAPQSCSTSHAAIHYNREILRPRSTRAPGHRRVQQGPAAHLLAGSSARCSAASAVHRIGTPLEENSCATMPAAWRSTPRQLMRWCASHRPLCLRQPAVPGAWRGATSYRGARQPGCRMAGSSQPSPTSREREGCGGLNARMNRSSGGCGAHRELMRSTPSLAMPKARPSRPTSRKHGFSPLRATTSAAAQRRRLYVTSLVERQRLGEDAQPSAISMPR